MDTRAALEDIVSRIVTIMAPRTPDDPAFDEALLALDAVEALAKNAKLQPSDRMSVVTGIGSARIAFLGGKVPNGKPIIRTEVKWREIGKGGAWRWTRIDPSRIGSGSAAGSSPGQSAAAEVVSENFDSEPAWGAVGHGPTIEIVSPSEWAGEYRVAISRNERRGRVILGFTGYDARDGVSSTGRQSPERIMSSYKLLVGRYGDRFPMTLEYNDEVIVDTLVAMYEDGRLHDLGMIVKHIPSGRIGVLLDRVLDEGRGYPSPEALDAFDSTSEGCRIECALLGPSRDIPGLVVFVPHDRVDRAAALSMRLEEML